jgi:hypothetical protein
MYGAKNKNEQPERDQELGPVPDELAGKCRLGIAIGLIGRAHVMIFAGTN